jgi:hypothetical protein
VEGGATTEKKSLAKDGVGVDFHESTGKDEILLDLGGRNPRTLLGPLGDVGRVQSQVGFRLGVFHDPPAVAEGVAGVCELTQLSPRPLFWNLECCLCTQFLVPSDSVLHGLNVRALRFFSVWGPGQRPDLAIESFQRAIERDQPVTILGDGSQRRDLTHVSDVARAVELAIGFHGDGFEAFNVGTGVNHSVMDMLRHSSSKTGKNPVVLHSALHPADVQETLADTRKSYILLEFQPLHPFQI